MGDMKYGLADVPTSRTKMVGVGSPPAFSNKILAGKTAITGSPNASGYVVFGETFNSVPNTIFANLDTGASELSIANITTGSFQANAVTAGTFSGNVLWLAVGSGQL